jgi:hypothetical protein
MGAEAPKKLAAFLAAFFLLHLLSHDFLLSTVDESRLYRVRLNH